MGIENQIVESWWLECDRCHLHSLLFDEEDTLLHYSRRAGWTQRTDGALRPQKVWLCPRCTAQVRIEQGEA